MAKFLPVIEHFGGHFEKHPLFEISRIFENMLDDVASYCFCKQNWYSNYKKHFILILIIHNIKNHDFKYIMI